MRGQRITTRRLDPFGVYIHFPFCRSKCGYCDFPSVASAEIPDGAYTKAVLDELEARSAAYAQLDLRSIYLGGGTPSLWSTGSLDRVLAATSSRFTTQAVPEVTLELNPGPPDAPLAEAAYEQLLRAGLNRLSIGIQSLDDRMLELLGRVHDARAARQTVRRARAAGFERISCDLIFGLPGQTVAHHLDQLNALVDLGPEHISAYSLTLSAAAPMRHAGLVPVSDDLMAELMAAGSALLEGAGYQQYEVSSFARPGAQSVHNVLVWAGQPYLGLGAYAHSMLPEGPSTLRVANPGLELYLRPSTYAGTPPRHGDAAMERLDPPGSCFEHLFMGLRTTAGVAREGYRRRFGADVEEHFRDPLGALQRDGLVTLSTAAVSPTARGLLFGDEVALRLVPS
jgi:putative oxygen-independent coproporphyrinogen III oxidase